MSTGPRLHAREVLHSFRASVRPALGPPRCRNYPRLASTSSAGSNASGSSTAKPRQRGFYIPLSLIVLIPTLYYLRPSSPPSLSPIQYSDHPISASTPLSASHKLITVPLSPSSLAAFQHPPTPSDRGDASHAQEEEGVVVWHVMIKNPDLQIERPYTPINDVLADGELALVVKKVQGGEVGRHIHGIPPKGDIGLRGPLPTFKIRPGEFDRVVMISSGTGIAPFLQLLSKVPGDDQGGKTRYHLIHSLAKDSASDWIRSPALPALDQLSQKHGNSLSVDRISLDPLDRKAISRALQREKDEKIMVLVCLPPHLMRPICGPLTVTLGQGELTGLLSELGLRGDEVWKLE